MAPIPVTSDQHILEVVELQINVPYGHVAAKWWGRRDVRPILCIHGWQDNAGTFDTLIPLLPDHVGYLAIDLPGHGLSSRIPNGLLYNNIDEIYVINFIVKQFGWDKVSLMGHSLGAISAFLFAALFPKMVDLVVTLDGLHPRIISKSHVEMLMKSLGEMHIIEQRNISGEEPPNYTYDELIDKMNSQTMLSVKRSSANYLLARSVKESSKETGRYYFTRDSRLKYHQFSYFTPKINVSLAKSIECPLLFVKALQSPYYTPKEQPEKIVEAMMTKPDFEMVTVDGGHHVHLNEPWLLSGVVSEFVLKHRPARNGSHHTAVVSKL